jgi:hypothetical protein
MVAPTTNKFKANFVGSTNRDLADKVSDTFSSKDFNGLSDGVSDDTLAINLAVASLALSGVPSLLILPRNTVFVEANLELDPLVTIQDMSTRGSIRFILAPQSSSLPVTSGGIAIKTQGIDGVLLRVHDSGIAGNPYLQVLNEDTGQLANINLGGLNLNKYVDIKEISDPPAPESNAGRLFVRDNGSGKSQVCIRFNTGAVQVIATEP